MAVDIGPELYKRIAEEYNRRVSSDRDISALSEKIRRMAATQEDVAKYAQRLGELSSEVLKNVLKLSDMPNETLYWNIAEKTIAPVLTNVHAKVNSEGAVQLRSTDKAKELDLRIARGVNPVSRIRGVMNIAVNSVNQDELNNALTDPVITTARKFYDDFLRANAEVRTGLGFNTTVIREYDGVGLHGRKTPCEWCLSRAGTFDYANAKALGVFERHPGCGCSIEVRFPDRVDIQTDWRTNTWTTL